MRHFTVTVWQFRVQIEEQTQPIKKIHARAVVDGDDWLYTIKKHPDNYQKRPVWMGRAYQNIHGHAHNSGTVVRFEPVHSKRTRKRKIHDKQLSMWD